MFSKRLSLFILCLVFFTSCFREVPLVQNHLNNQFKVAVLPSTLNEILEARGKQFAVDSILQMTYGGLDYSVEKFKIRGKSALNYQRKSYSVEIKNDIVLRDDNVYKDFNKFYLIALCEDYTYIENRLSHSFLSNIDLWPLYTFFTELKINDSHQGLYLFIEKPEEYLFNKEKAEVVIRRYYRGGIQNIDFNSKFDIVDSTIYGVQFNSIYNTLLDSNSTELYSKLAQKFNIKNYMRKLAFDYIIRNGDATDEIFFWGKTLSNNQVYFDILPWDCDDVFSDQPHEIWRAIFVGKLFGERSYDTYSEVIDVVGNKLIYSIEDDIDYAIATIPELYHEYLKEVEFVLSIFTQDKVKSIFDEVYKELTAFYEIPDITEQSQYDQKPTTFELFEVHIKDKEKYVLERINNMRNYILEYNKE